MARTKEVDRQFLGNGILKCDICSQPYIEHDIAPCPLLEAAIIYGAPVRGEAGRRNTGKCRSCGEQTPYKKNTTARMRYCSSYCRKKWSNVNGK